jgi:antitoxin VapB
MSAPFSDPRTTAKLFTHGGSQAVRLPKAFRFEGTEVSIRKEGDAVILEPIKTQETWAEFFARVDAVQAEVGELFSHPPRDDLIWPDPVRFDEE